MKRTTPPLSLTWYNKVDKKSKRVLECDCLQNIYKERQETFPLPPNPNMVSVVM